MTFTKSTATEQVAAKIRKILALADASRNPSEAEAAAAAEKVRELLRRHNLSMADVSGTSPTGEPSGGPSVEEQEDSLGGNPRGRMQSWRYRIARAAGKFCECSTFIRGGAVVFIGSPLDIAAARATAASWLAMGERIADRERNRDLNAYYMRRGEKVVWKRNFLSAFGQRLSERADEIRARESDDQSADGRKWELALVNKKAEISTYMRRSGYVIKQTRSSGRADYSAQQAGRAAANSVRMSRTSGLLG